MRKKRLLIVIENQNFSSHIEERLGLSKNMNNLSTYCWNLLPLINNETYNMFNEKIKRRNLKNKYIDIKSLKNLFHNISKIDQEFFYINNCKNSLLTCMIEIIFLIKKGKKILILPGSHKYKNKYHSRFKFLIDRGITDIFLKSIKYIYFKSIHYLFSKIHLKADIVFVGNQNDFNLINKQYKKEKIYKFNSPEYQKFLDCKSIKKKNLITYIDQPIHDGLDVSVNDYTKLNKNINMNNLKKINKFLDKVKKKYKKIQVVVAAHPRRKKNYSFFEKKVIFFKTIDLVAKSKFIIASHSLAIKYAVMLNKPIVILKNSNFSNLSNYEEQKFFKEELNLKDYDLSKKINFNKKDIFRKVDQKKYDNFIKNYINFHKKSNYGRWDAVRKVIRLSK